MSAQHIEELDFNDIIETVGNDGYFQKRFTWTFNFMLVICFAMIYMNKILSLNVPDHWCHVPGRENTNYTLDEWKNQTIPWEEDSLGGQSYSKCTRFANGSKENYFDTNKTIKCDHGWEYDTTWYDLTTTMQQDWVCDNEMIPINILAIISAGEMLASFIYGQISDNFGRLPVFYSAVLIVTITRIISIYTSNCLLLFMALNLIGSQTLASLQSPLIIAMEISRMDNRALISMKFCIAYTLGTMFAPLFMWWLRDWITFGLVTTIPSCLFLMAQPWIIESPRWLASRGKIKRCVKQLRKVAKTNNKHLPHHIEDHLRNFNIGQTDAKGKTIYGLFSSLGLAKNTIIMVYCFTTTLFIYISFLLSVGNLAGNPFLNYTLQAIAELPAFLIGQYVCDRYGRRFVTFFGFVSTSCGLFAVVYFIQDSTSFWIVNILCIILKTVIMLTHYCTLLQSTEIYPTCIRQTGVSMGTVFSNTINIFSPYVVTLGLTMHASVPYIIYAICTVIAAFVSLFLPETHGKQLPETLRDAANFGADQNFLGNINSKSTPIDDDKQVYIRLNRE